MEMPVINFPRYAKLSLILLSLCIIVVILYLGQNILIPLFLSLFFAILLRPMVRLLNTKFRFPHVLAVLVSVILFIAFIAAIVFFISWQIADMTDDWNKIKENLTLHFHNFQLWIKQQFHLSYNKQQTYIHQAEKSLNGNSELLGNTWTSFTDMLVNIVLIPVYTFLILMYRNLFIKFLYKMNSRSNQQNLQEVLTQVKTVVQSYIIGLFIEMGIVGTLIATGLMLLGVQYAILLGVITAILNLIPYLGIMVATLIAILATLVNSNDTSIIVGIIILNIIVQLIDNNFVVPKIVGNKVRINAMATMVGVIIGGTVGGIPGMILSIPLIAIIKVIFDHIESLKPWGYLLSNDDSNGFQTSFIKEIIKPSKT